MSDAVIALLIVVAVLGLLAISIIFSFIDLSNLNLHDSLFALQWRLNEEWMVLAQAYDQVGDWEGQMSPGMSDFLRNRHEA